MIAPLEVLIIRGFFFILLNSLFTNQMPCGIVQGAMDGDEIGLIQNSIKVLELDPLESLFEDRDRRRSP